MRIGHGYDVHKLVTGRPLILGGVNVPFTKGLLGHSDADVLAHAVTDALLGAGALGDIGTHYPDSDPSFKNADSIALLKNTVEKLKAQGYTVSNLDCTLVLQLPKVGPFLGEMAQNIACACGVAPNCVNIKATTEEGLGFTGTGQGVACHCVCLITQSV